MTLAALTSCAPAAESARPITTEESQLLAVVRFNNFNEGTRTVETSLRDAGTDLTLAGWVDYSTSTGFAMLTETATSTSSLLIWDATTLAARPATAAESEALAQPPISIPAITEDFGTAPLSPQGALHPLLAILIALGNDRPDNPLLLQQGGALWLRADTVGGTPVTVFSGPTSPTDETVEQPSTVDPDAANARYWVDADGLLLRCEVKLGSDWVTIDFGSAPTVHLENPFTTDAP